jgi:GLPGLI family protein
MKTFYLTTILILLTKLLFPQNIKAVYTATRNISVNLPEKGTTKIGKLDFDCYFFKKGNKYISFNKPNYLNIYPDGKMKVLLSENHSFYFELMMDTIQNLVYKDLDSLIKRDRPDISGKNKVDSNYVQEFDLNYFEWEILPEIKIVNGLRCQRAKQSIRLQPQWDVWFCPDIPAQAGISYIINIPGLIVEANHIPLGMIYTLQKYELNVPIEDNIFWPKEFNLPFKIRKSLRVNSLKNQQQEKSKILKQAELTNQ